MISSGSYKEKVAKPSHKPMSDSRSSALLIIQCTTLFFNEGEIYINIKLTILKCKIQWHLEYAQRCAITTLVKFQNIFITPNH